MSKILFVGDIHTKDWIIDKVDELLNTDKEIDKAVFIGDYLDEFGATYNDNINILNKVINVKNKNKDKVTLLIGNHELSYLGFPCSGHIYNENINDLLKQNLDLFDLIYEEDNFIVSHGGLTKNWIELLINEYNQNSIDDIIKLLNIKFHDKCESLFNYLSMASFTSGSNSSIASLLWSRPKDHLYNSIKYKTQIVGHTPTNEPIHPIKYVNESSSIYYIDTFSLYRNMTPIGTQEVLIYDRDRNEYYGVELKMNNQDIIKETKQFLDKIEIVYNNNDTDICITEDQYNLLNKLLESYSKEKSKIDVVKTIIQNLINSLEAQGYWEFLETKDLDKCVDILKSLQYSINNIEKESNHERKEK